jgi:hypothetical protein
MANFFMDAFGDYYLQTQLVECCGLTPMMLRDAVTNSKLRN